MISSLPPQRTIPPDWELLEGGVGDMGIRLTHRSLEDMGWEIHKGEALLSSAPQNSLDNKNRLVLSPRPDQDYTSDPFSPGGKVLVANLNMGERGTCTVSVQVREPTSAVWEDVGAEEVLVNPDKLYGVGKRLTYAVSDNRQLRFRAVGNNDANCSFWFADEAPNDTLANAPVNARLTALEDDVKVIKETIGTMAADLTLIRNTILGKSDT